MTEIITQKTITVGIADLNVTTAPNLLATYALGSCVGICLYDERVKLGGMAHIMLPWSKDINSSVPKEPKKFADTGIRELVLKMEQLGANKDRLTAKIAGGAQMFATASSAFNIGERNVNAVKEVLAYYKIPIIASQTGENFGRTIYFDAQNGMLKIKSAIKGIDII